MLRSTQERKKKTKKNPSAKSKIILAELDRGFAQTLKNKKEGEMSPGQEEGIEVEVLGRGGKGGEGWYQRSSMQEVQEGSTQFESAGVTVGHGPVAAPIIMSVHAPLETMGKIGVVAKPKPIQVLDCKSQKKEKNKKKK